MSFFHGMLLGLHMPVEVTSDLPSIASTPYPVSCKVAGISLVCPDRIDDANRPVQMGLLIAPHEARGCAANIATSTWSYHVMPHCLAFLLWLLVGTLGYAQNESVKYWRSREAAFNDLVFSRAPGELLPLASSLSPEDFMLPSYAGGHPNGEGICVLSFLLSADLSGDQRVKPLLPSALRWTTPQGIPSNTIGGKSSTSYWYELFPAVLLSQLAMRHPESIEMDANLVRMADRYAGIIRDLGGPDADFNQTSFISHRSKKGPFSNGKWTEPDAAAAMAYVCYSAWLRHHQPAHLKAAHWAMDSLERRKPTEGNPFYEFCLYCAPSLAARMNREQGTHYDVRKLMDWCLGKNDGKNACRPWWGRVDHNFNGIQAAGLCGDTRSGNAYVFAMNSFVAAAMIAPLAAEDPTFAPEIGRWLVQVSRNARNFFPDEVPADRQSSPEFRGTPLAAIPYEGLREQKRLLTSVSESAPGHWLAELNDAKGDFQWIAKVKQANGRAIKLRAINGDGQQIYFGNYTLKPGQTSLGGMLRSTDTPLRLEFSIDGAPVELTELRVENYPGTGPWLTGDPVFFGWGPKSDLSVYGGACIGLFTALMVDSGHPAIQAFDLGAINFLGSSGRPSLLLVNTSEIEITHDGVIIPPHGTLLKP
jgi:hypothetical protein